jgi:simple sugar transport system substrate-binding protein
MSANPDIKLVVTDHGNLTGTQQTFFESAGLGPDDVFGSGFDLSEATVEAIRGGWTDLVIDQQQWLQGYLAVLQICLTNNYAFSVCRSTPAPALLIRIMLSSWLRW